MRGYRYCTDERGSGPGKSYGAFPSAKTQARPKHTPTEDAAFRFTMSFTGSFAVREFHPSSVAFHCMGVSPLLILKGADRTGKTAPTLPTDSFAPAERFGGFYSGTGISYPENAPPMGPNISSASFAGSRGYHCRQPWTTLLCVDNVTVLKDVAAAALGKSYGVFRGTAPYGVFPNSLPPQLPFKTFLLLL